MAIETEAPKQNPRRPNMKKLLTFIAVLVLIGVGLVVYKQWDKNRTKDVAETPQVTVEESKDTATVTPPAETPAPAPAVTPQPANTAAPSREPVAATPAPEASSAPVVYRNANLGYELTLPPGWAAREVGGREHRVIFYNTANPADYRYVEVLVGSQQDAGGLEAQLKNSPSVKDVGQVDFAGNRGVQFRYANSRYFGLGVPKGDKVYFLNDNTESPVLGSLKFL